MNNPIKAALILLASVMSGSVFASEAWMLVSKDSHQSLVHATDAGIEQVAALGDLTIYANTAQKIGLMTRDKKAQTGKLLIVNKATRSVEASVPVFLYPASQLSGSTEDLVLIGDYAFFATVRFSSDGMTAERNALGGTFDIGRVSIKTGAVEVFPLPEAVHNPRVAAIAGKAVIDAGDGKRAWQLDAASDGPREVAASRALGTMRSREIDAFIGTANTPAQDAVLGSIVSLPDQSRVYVDSVSGSVDRLAKDGSKTELWNITRDIPGAVPSATRVIDFH